MSTASVARSVGVASDWSGHGIPTKPVGGLLSDIGNGDPCLRLTGRAVPDRPEMVLRPSLCLHHLPRRAQMKAAISDLTAGVEPAPRG